MNYFIHRINLTNIIGLLIFILFLSGCGQQTSTEIREASEFTESERYGGTYRMAQMSDPRTFDPSGMWDVSSHGTLSALLYNGLIRFDIEGNLMPDLAERWEISPDGTEYTFHLRRNVRFHNGDPFTARDVEFSFKRFLAEPRSYYKWILRKVKGSEKFMNDVEDYRKRANRSVPAIELIDKIDFPGLKIVDDYTIVITLEQPYAPFIKGLAMPQAFIASPRAVKEFKEDFPRNPVGTGPFKLTEWVENSRVVFEANEYYFEGRPYLDKIVVSIIKDETSILLTYERGDLESMLVPDAEFNRIMNDPSRQPYIVSRQTLVSHSIRLGNHRKPFDNKKVRQALNYAIDKQKILDTVLNQRGVVSVGPVPTNVPGYQSRQKGYAYNPEKARQLLREAGFPNGFKMQIHTSESKAHLEVVQVFQAYLRDVGIDVEIVQNEWSTLNKAILDGTVDAWFPRAWAADYPCAENFLFPLFHSSNIPAGGNSARYRNLELDKILERASYVVDPEQRLEYLHQAEAIIVADAPQVFLWYPIIYVMHQPWVHNYQLPLIYYGNKMNEIWISKR